MLFYAMPQFWLGMMMVLVFSAWLAWLPRWPSRRWTRITPDVGASRMWRST